MVKKKKEKATKKIFDAQHSNYDDQNNSKLNVINEDDFVWKLKNIHKGSKTWQRNYC